MSTESQYNELHQLEDEMREVAPMQEVITKGEHEALALANLLRAGRVNDAAARLEQFALDNKIAYWEKVAIADIAKQMNAGKPWKRT